MDQIPERFQRVKPGADFSVFLVCLLIAFTFWLLNAFTKSYSTVVEIPITYINLPQDRVLSNELPEKASAELNGTGFRLLSVSFFNTPDPIIVDFDKGSQRGNEMRIESSFGSESLRSQIMDEIPSEVSLGEFSLDSLKVVLESKNTRTIGIAPQIAYEMEYPFFLNGEISTNPATIEISGGNSRIHAVKQINTEALDFNQLTKRIEKDVELEFPEGVSSKTKMVTLTIPVDQYTEGKKQISIRTKNLSPEEELLLFPAKVEVTYLVGLSDFDKVSEDQFVFEVDAKEIIKGKTTLIVRQIDQPQKVQIQDFKPHKVEFILKK